MVLLFRSTGGGSRPVIIPRMNTSPIDRFLKDLRESALVREDLLGRHLDLIQDGDPKALALALVQVGLLTDWQAKYLLSGRSRLRVGNYLLLERVRRDELGDCFIALHEPLQRRVKLQILPEQITRQSSGFAAVTALVGRLTSLDHSRVEHVYDLGEEGGRLFVVFETSQGRPLDSRMAAGLTEGEAAGAMQGLSSGLAYLQSREVGHGGLAAGGLLLSEDGEGKIVGLCDSLLRRALEGDQLLSNDELLSTDRRQWKEIAERLIAKHFRGPEFSAWSKLLQQSIDQPQRLEALAAQIGAWRKELAASNGVSDLDLPVARESAAKLPPSKTPERAEGQPPAGGGARRAGAKRSTVDRASSSPNPDWRKLYLTGVCSLVLLGLCGFGIWRFWPLGVSAPPRSAAAVRATDEGASPVSTRRSEQPLDKVRQAKVLMETQTQPAAEVRPLAGELLEAAKAEPVIEKPVVQQLPGLQEREPVTAELDNSLLAEPTELLAAASEKAGETNVASEPAWEKTLDKQALPGGAGKADPLLKSPEVNKPALLVSPDESTSLKNFPKVVNLGLPGGGAVLLGPPSKLKFEELKLSLQYDPETVARSKTFFEVQPLVEQSAWRIASKKRLDDPEAQPVGEFRLLDGQLQFSWAEGVEPRDVGLTLCNCGLILESVDGTTCVVKLREPALFEGFVLDEKKLSAETNLELPALPNPENIKVRFGPFSADGPWAEAMVLNDEFEDRQPAVVAFRPLESEQLCGLAVQRQLRGRIELSAAWAVRQPDKWQPMKQTDFKKVVEAMAQTYAQSVVQSDLAARAIETAVRGTKGKTEDAAKAAKKLSLEFAKQNELMGAHEEILNQILQQEIPVRLVYQAAGRELILAETKSACEAAAAAAAAEVPPPIEQADEAKKKK